MLTALLIPGWFPSFGDETSSEPEDDRPSIEDHSKMEIRKKIIKQEQKLEKIEDALDTRREAYQAHLQKGAKSPKQARQVYAIKARLEKFKAKVQRLERNKTVKNLTMWELARGYREISSLIDSVESDLSASEILDFDPEGLQADIQEMNADLHAEMKEIENMMDSFDVSESSHSIGTVKEEELMDMIAAGDVSAEELDLEVEDLETDSTRGQETSDVDLDREASGEDEFDVDEELPDEWNLDDEDELW